MEQIWNLKSEGLYSNPVILLHAMWVTLAKSLNLSESSFLFYKIRIIIPALPTSQCCCEDQMRFYMWKFFETLQNTTQIQAIVTKLNPVGSLWFLSHTCPCWVWSIIISKCGWSVGFWSFHMKYILCVCLKPLPRSSSNGPLRDTFKTSRTSISDLVPVTYRSTIVSQRETYLNCKVLKGYI